MHLSRPDGALKLGKHGYGRRNVDLTRPQSGYKCETELLLDTWVALQPAKWNGMVANFRSVFLGVVGVMYCGYLERP